MQFSRLNKILLSLTALLLSTNCAGPYKGRLIDEKSGAPIQGVVAVGYWTYMSPNVGGGTTHCLDARETVSDENGEFTIPTSTYGEFFGEMNVAIYKVGYERLGPGPWISLKEALILKDKVKWEGDQAIIPMKRVGNNRLMYEGEPPHVSCGRKDEKPLVEYIKVRKEYRRALGLEP